MSVGIDRKSHTSQAPVLADGFAEAFKRGLGIEVTVEPQHERKSGFTQAAVTRAVKGVAKATGAQIGKVEVTPDKITVEIAKAEQADDVMSLADWRKRRHAAR